VSRVLRPTRHITGHFRDESFQTITCTDTDDVKQVRENAPRAQKTHKVNKISFDKKNAKPQGNQVLCVRILDQLE